MGSANDYDAEVRVIEAHNAPILDSFQTWLTSEGLSKMTVKSHMDNMEFFADYLVYDDPLQRLNEADEVDVGSFLLDWFPRKAMWASVSSTKSYLASFKKFFVWLREADRISPEVVDDILTMIKEDRQEFLEAVEDDAW